MMSISEQTCSNSSTPTSVAVLPVREIDPLLKDLNEKKQSFRRNVVSLAAELKEVRGRLASKEQLFAKEAITRQEAEHKAKNMEDQIYSLQKTLEERNCQLQSSASNSEKYLKELDGLRSQLAATQVTADASAASAQAAHIQCLALLKELDDKNSSLKEHEDRVTRLGEQLDNLQRDLKARESSQKQLKDEVMRIEHDIMQAITKAGSKDCELRKLLDEVSPKNFEKINRLLTAKDEEIAKLKDEMRIMSAHWKLKTKELESQLEKQRRTDQELKKRVLKLEFCLQEARAQTRKLQRLLPWSTRICQSSLSSWKQCHLPVDSFTRQSGIFYMLTAIIPVTKDVSSTRHLANGFPVADPDVELLTPGGASDPKTVALPKAGLLEFKTDGGVLVLPKA